ncbi:MAG: hypothetical protein M3253_07670 [Chloroflexota bacterium]|nr:hypothetical protein [Chloroflexota bacterium]
MEITLADERLFLLEERATFDEIRQRAADKRTGAFGGGIGGLLQRPKNEEVNLVNTKRRLEPFWHIAGRSRYEYERNRTYNVPASGAEVRRVTVLGSEYDITTGALAFQLPVLEHCLEEYRREVFLDAQTGQPVADAAQLITGPRSEVHDLATLSANETVVIPPEQRASFVVRTVMQEITKAVQADRMIEETLVLETADLYYRPIWSFEYKWVPRDRTGFIEIDGVTGQIRQTNQLLPQIKGMVMNKETWFDIGADTVELLVPGGGIAMKVARAVAERK